MRLQNLITVFRYWGIRQTIQRIYYEVARKIGRYIYRFPTQSWRIWIPKRIEDTIREIRNGERFFLPLDFKVTSSEYRDAFFPHYELLKRAEHIGNGQQQYFNKLWGQHNDWFQNPFTKQTINPDEHWSNIRFSSPLYGDLKIILEPSRFAFAYHLIRTYWYTNDEQYPALFWGIFDDWCEKNPPQSGPMWVCGQESAIRVIAWCFALYGFKNSEYTTDDNITKLLAFIVAHADRIEGTLTYAKSQKNNHILSEATALWTIGLLFPNLDKAQRWRQIGCKILIDEVTSQVYDDGSYIQHSNNYHRVMLQLLVWTYHLGEINHYHLPDIILQRIKLALNFLFNITDLKTGKVPNYGANDGALILPLNGCDYADFRPILQAAHYMVYQKRLFPSGPWDEDLFWLFGAQAMKTEIKSSLLPQKDFHADTGGYYTLRSDTGFAFVRCASFRHRPGQADMLHLDLWWHGQNIAMDAGTYSYNAPPPWNNSLAGTAYHNTVTVDGQDQMERVGRFLWLPWLRSRVRHNLHSPEKHLTYWEGEHNGYHRLGQPVYHRRGILRLGNDWWLVVDGLCSTGHHDYRLHWLFPDVPYQWHPETGRLSLQTTAGPYYAHLSTTAKAGQYSLVRADENSPRGWHSPYYYHREPALSVALNARTEALYFLTLFGPEARRLTIKGTILQLKTDQWQTEIHLSPVENHPDSLVNSVSITGMITDKLEIIAGNPG